MNRKTILNNWEKTPDAIAFEFVKKYYGKECVADYYWIADDIGGCLAINDEFWSLDRMKTALELNATYEQIMEFYYYETELPEDEKVIINFKNYLKLGTVWKKK